MIPTPLGGHNVINLPRIEKTNLKLLVKKLKTQITK